MKARQQKSRSRQSSGSHQHKVQVRHDHSAQIEPVQLLFEFNPDLGEMFDPEQTRRFAKIDADCALDDLRAYAPHLWVRLCPACKAILEGSKDGVLQPIA